MGRTKVASVMGSNLSLALQLVRIVELSCYYKLLFSMVGSSVTECQFIDQKSTWIIASGASLIFGILTAIALDNFLHYLKDLFSLGLSQNCFEIFSSSNSYFSFNLVKT